MPTISETAKKRLAELKKGNPLKPVPAKNTKSKRAQEREEVEELSEVGLRPPKKR